MKVKFFSKFAIVLALSASSSIAAINIQVDLTGFTTQQEAIFTRAENDWETHLTGYRDTTNNPTVVTITATAADLGPNLLGFAGPRDLVVSGAFTYTSTAEMQFNTRFLNVDDQFLYETIFHEMGHALGFGTLWEANGVYTAGTGQFLGAAALEKYQRDFDPTATFVPVELDGGQGTADGHWNEGGNQNVNNADTPYDGLPLDNEILSGSAATAGEILTDVTIGAMYDIGYTVKYIVPEQFFWDAGNPTNNGAIESADGTWDFATTNWSTDGGTNNAAWVDENAAIFSDTGSIVTLAGPVIAAELQFLVDGYTITGGSLNTDIGTRISVFDVAHSVDLNTTISGTGALTINGAGTVNNLGTISSELITNANSVFNNTGTVSGVASISGSAINNGTGIFSGDLTINTGGSLSSDAAGLADTITLNNNGTVNLTADETVANYTSSAGTLNSTGTFTAANYDLNNGSVVNANIGAGNIQADGLVTLNGNIDALLNVNSGATTNNGLLNNSTVNILGGNLINTANGIADASTVNNAGTFTLAGNDTIDNYVATTGTLTGNGILTVTSTFSGGTIDTTATSNTTLSLIADVTTATTTLGAGTTLKFSDGTTQLELFDTFLLFAGTTGIIGDATSIGFENFDLTSLDSSVTGVFDVTTGVITITGGSSASASTPNTSAVANALYGGNAAAGRFTNVNGIAANAADVLTLAQTLANASASDNVTLQTQMEELSPEVYGGIAEYGIRNSLNVIDSVYQAPYVVRNGSWHIFAGSSSMDLETASSIDNANFNVDGTNSYFGISKNISERSRFGFFGASNTGDITSNFLNLEASGKTVGIFTEKELNMPWYDGVRWGRLRGSISLSDYSYDGTRMAQGLTNSVNDASSKVFQAGLEYSATLWDYENFKVSPFIGVNLVNSSSDAFEETGTINSLSIQSYEKTQLLANFGLDATWTPAGGPLGLTATVKFQQHLLDDESEISASFAGTTNTFTVVSPGVSESTVEIGLGAFYKLGGNAMLHANVYKLSGDDLEGASGVNVGIDIEW